MQMLGKADLDYLTDNPPVAEPVGPVGGPGTEDFRLRLEAWFNRQGVDHQAIMDWSMEQSVEDVGNLEQLVMMGADPVALMGAMLATAYTLGIQTGWRLHQRSGGR